MTDIILCNLSDANATADEARTEWVIEVLVALDISEELIEMGFSDGNDYDEFKYSMNELGIDIELHSNGDVDVYKKVWVDGPTEEECGWLPSAREHLVAQWENPERVRRISKDKSEVYYELHLKEWSIADMRQI